MKTLGIYKLLGISICFVLNSLASSAQNDTLYFNSSKEFNQYRFGNTILENTTAGFLLDLEDEWSKVEIDSFLNLVATNNSDVDGLLDYLNLLERTDVNYLFERDSILFPIMDHFSFNDGSTEIKVPLFIMSHDFSRLSFESRGFIDNWTGFEPYPSFSQNNFQTERVFYSGVFADTLRGDNIALYWNNDTYIRNTDLQISSVHIGINGASVELLENETLNINQFLGAQAVNQIQITVVLSDSTTYITNCGVYFDNAPTSSSNETLSKAFGGWEGEYGDENHKVDWTVLYGCDDELLNRPFIFVAGWGTYTGKDWLNGLQGWPTNEYGLYLDWNQANIIDELRQFGYDVVIVRFTPPNASTQKNADKLKYVIKWVNIQKAQANSNEENIILGYSAGAMCVRLALEQMEKAHLEQGDRHPHTKLYISYDGEHQGANIPLAVQHATEYLDEYQGGPFAFTIYAMHYILNAPLSKELLYYFWEQTGSAQNPGQGPHGSRWELLQAFNDASHSKTPPERLGYPAFSRCISISNGQNESNYGTTSANHFPYPSNFGYRIYKQINPFRIWEANFNAPGGNTVFRYTKFSWSGLQWVVKMEGVTGPNCLVLDNAPGGMVLIETNPLTAVMEQMKSKINLGNPQIYFPHTQFAFTPTVLTHDIRNFNAASNGYRMEYTLKHNNLMFQSVSNFSEFQSTSNDLLISNYFGYPHIGYPYSHYWEATPFDAVFSCNYNTEHILFNNCTRSDPNNNNEQWLRISDPSATVVKNFILEEADYFDVYVQNKRYGFNARTDYTYTADIIVPNAIYVGKEVTQRTDFKEAEFLDNSNLYLQAGEEIHLEPGTWVQAGAQFHALIGPFHCDYFKSTMRQNQQDNQEEMDLNAELPNFNLAEGAGRDFVVYPNPSEGIVHIRHIAPEITAFEFAVFDLDGKLILSGESRERITSFEAKKGMYILKLTNHENTSVHKILVR